MSPRNADLFRRAPSMWEQVRETKTYVEDLDQRIYHSKVAIEQASRDTEAYFQMAMEQAPQDTEAYLQMAVEAERNLIEHERILQALRAERRQYADPEDYLKELFRLREAGE